MPHSDGDNKPWSMEQIRLLNPKTILDVGAGAGIWSELAAIHIPEAVIDCVEAWEPYVFEYNLNDKYKNVFVQDVRDFNDFNYDLVIFGDVLEHMSEEDAKKLWGKAASQAKYGLISVPIIHYPQGPHGGNPFEVHVVEDWTTEKVLSVFSNIVLYKEFDITGVYIAKF